VLSFCENFRQSKPFPNRCNRTQIVLIPKISKPDKITNLEPNALCNVLYKILAKTLVNRIKPLLQKLISKAQCVFVLSRLISDNLLHAYESQHYINRKNQGKSKVVGMNLNMSKTYDRVSWDMVKWELRRLGFNNEFVGMTSGCIRFVQ